MFIVTFIEIKLLIVRIIPIRNKVIWGDLLLKNLLLPIGIYNSFKDWAYEKDEPVPNGAAFKEIHPATSFFGRIIHPPNRYPNVLRVVMSELSPMCLFGAGDD